MANTRRKPLGTHIPWIPIGLRLVFAKIHLWYGDSEFTIDSRPSDAIALALRAEAPIFTTEDVLKKQSSEELERWLENLKPEDFGKYET